MVKVVVSDFAEVNNFGTLWNDSWDLFRPFSVEIALSRIMSVVVWLHVAWLHVVLVACFKLSIALIKIQHKLNHVKRMMKFYFLSVLNNIIFLRHDKFNSITSISKSVNCDRSTIAIICSIIDYIMLKTNWPGKLIRTVISWLVLYLKVEKMNLRYYFSPLY